MERDFMCLLPLSSTGQCLPIGSSGLHLTGQIIELPRVHREQSPQQQPEQSKGSRERQVNRDSEGVETHCKQFFGNESQECAMKLALFAFEAWLLGILTSTTQSEDDL